MNKLTSIIGIALLIGGMTVITACDDLFKKSDQAATCEAPKIKGNISDDGQKIYHVPGGAYYDRVDVELNKGEQLFCTEADAEAAGYTKSLR
jgi:hypothetical protein